MTQNLFSIIDINIKLKPFNIFNYYLTKMTNALPQNAIALINAYSKPMTHPYWRFKKRPAFFIKQDDLYIGILDIAYNKKVPVIETFLKNKLNGRDIGMFMWAYKQYGPKHIITTCMIPEEIVEQFGTFAGLY